jgi:hypothetical protein
LVVLLKTLADFGAQVLTRVQLDGQIQTEGSRFMKTLLPKFSASLLIFWSIGVVCTLPSKGAMYSIQYGVGESPFVGRPPTVDYQVEPTGSSDPIAGPHGFILHHNGVDTHVNIDHLLCNKPCRERPWSGGGQI